MSAPILAPVWLALAQTQAQFGYEKEARRSLALVDKSLLGPESAGQDIALQYRTVEAMLCAKDGSPVPASCRTRWEDLQKQFAARKGPPKFAAELYLVAIRKSRDEKESRKWQLQAEQLFASTTFPVAKEWLVEAELERKNPLVRASHFHPELLSEFDDKDFLLEKKQMPLPGNFSLQGIPLIKKAEAAAILGAAAGPRIQELPTAEAAAAKAKLYAALEPLVTGWPEGGKQLWEAAKNYQLYHGTKESTYGLLAKLRGAYLADKNADPKLEFPADNYRSLVELAPSPAAGMRFVEEGLKYLREAREQGARVQTDEIHFLVACGDAYWKAADPVRALQFYENALAANAKQAARLVRKDGKEPSYRDFPLRERPMEEMERAQVLVRMSWAQRSLQKHSEADASFEKARTILKTPAKGVAIWPLIHGVIFTYEGRFNEAKAQLALADKDAAEISNRRIGDAFENWGRAYIQKTERKGWVR